MVEVNVPALLKELRQRLELTQEQFAQAVGVTFSTVNQWENGRRRPQPFLLKRLLEMAARSEAGSADRLTRSEAETCKRRWKAVNAAEREELSSTPIAHKFRQAAALLASAGSLKWPEARIAEEDLIRQRWTRLRQERYA